MPKLTIVRDDDIVIVDGLALKVDCAPMVDVATPGARVHAVQWNGTRGEIEFSRDQHAGNTSPVRPNRTIDGIDQFAAVVAAWNAAAAVHDALLNARAAQAPATPVVKP